jgi:membrane protein
MSFLALAVASVRRFLAIDGYDRALALAAQSFVAVVPLILVVAAWAPRDRRERAGRWLVAGLGLDDATAATVRELVARPPGATEPVTVVGLALLVVSVLGFARSLQRTVEAAWTSPAPACAATAPGCWVGPCSSGTSLRSSSSPNWRARCRAHGCRDGCAGGRGDLVWWPVLRLLVGGRVGWRDLLPGAVVAGVGRRRSWRWRRSSCGPS